MGPAPRCDRTSRCRNFRLREHPACNECGTPITGNHFHDSVEGYRICDACFRRHLEAIAAGTFRPRTWIRGEVRDCLLFERCFAPAPYSLFELKVCDGCGREAPPQHYHDVTRNIRLCLACAQERL